MRKVLVLAAGIVVLIAGSATKADAQVLGLCTVEAAATQQECLASGNPPAECAAYYQEDIAECSAYGNAPIGGPVFTRPRAPVRRMSAPPRSAPRPAPAPAPRAPAARAPAGNGPAEQHR
jgi:hypothetical protein